MQFIIFFATFAILSVGSVIANDSKSVETTCISCHTDSDEQCRDEPDLIEPTKCTSSIDDLGCFLMQVDSKRVRRGCVSDLTAEEQQLCLVEDDTCKICHGDDCNTKVGFQYCYECSSQNGAECADLPTVDQVALCPEYLDQCATAVNIDGITIRQCVSFDTNTNPDPDEYPEFETCTDDKCNGYIYPPDRLQCFQCDAYNCNGTSLDAEVPCRVYSKYDRCYTFIDDVQNMYRGCTSDSKDSRIICEHGLGVCEICEGRACNDQLLFTHPTLSCHKCDGSKECGYGLNDQDSSENCTEPVRFGIEETCFTQFDDNQTVSRGCTVDKIVDDPQWCETSESCNECTGDDCNDKNVFYSFCLQCNSLTDNDCGEPLLNSDEIYRRCGRMFVSKHSEDQNDDETEIEFEPYPFSQRGCYTIVKGGIVERGCVSTSSNNHFESCKNVEYCEICLDDYCNDKSFPSSANTLPLASYTFMLIPSTLWLLTP